MIIILPLKLLLSLINPDFSSNLFLVPSDKQRQLPHSFNTRSSPNLVNTLFLFDPPNRNRQKLTQITGRVPLFDGCRLSFFNLFFLLLFRFKFLLGKISYVWAPLNRSIERLTTHELKRRSSRLGSSEDNARPVVGNTWLHRWDLWNHLKDPN